MTYINRDNLFDFAFLNEDTLRRPLRGIAVSFHGYSDATMLEKSPEEARVLGEAGIAWVFPYYSVWAWMSKSSQIFNEQVLDAVYDRLGAPDSIPLVITGGSMGGLTALNYLVYGKRPATACAVNCPVTDMCEVFENRPAVRRAILAAHITEERTLGDILAHHSPCRFVDRLPKIPYLFLYGERDERYTHIQMPPMKKALEASGLDYTITIWPNMEHCDFANHPDARQYYCRFILSAIDGR